MYGFKLFPFDNGSEFKKVDELELTLDEDGFLVYRTSLYYCDQMASWQKGCIEKNHEFIRYAVPKGKSLNPTENTSNNQNSVLRSNKALIMDVQIQISCYN